MMSQAWKLEQDILKEELGKSKKDKQQELLVVGADSTISGNKAPVEETTKVVEVNFSVKVHDFTINRRT